jgi:uncharacterized protein (DUF1015 family)
VITIRPVTRALVPVDAAAAARVSAPNYDEFQSDREIQGVIAQSPESVLRITMAHCDVPAGAAPLQEGSPPALERATRSMVHLAESPLTREVEDVLWVYEILDPARPGVRQIGVGGMGLLEEIRTPATPRGSIIRNEGIREAKSRGRADLIKATGAIIGTVNNAVDDREGHLAAALEALADRRPPDYEVTDDHQNRHRIWLEPDPETIRRLQALMAAESHAYVADGNHRSAAAAMLGHAEFLTVFFPKASMGIRPYNRLISSRVTLPADLHGALTDAFDVRPRPDVDAYQPEDTHDIGVYAAGSWYELAPKAGTYDPENAVQDIDADIVQRHLFHATLGIEDARDDRLRFVGSNRDAAYLRDEVDGGAYSMAVTLPPVTMEQFIRVCLQDRMMPPKSTWFEPKIRSGLVMALL